MTAAVAARDTGPRASVEQDEYARTLYNTRVLPDGIDWPAIPEDRRMSKASARLIIDALRLAERRGDAPPREATERMDGWAKKLFVERVHPAGFAQVAPGEGRLMWDAARAIIDALKDQPYAGQAELRPGYYRGGDGRVVELVMSKANRLYGKVLDEEERKFEFDLGGVALAAAGHRMTVSELAEYGFRTNRCIRCQTPLELAVSRKRGFGPDCFKLIAATHEP